MLTLIAAVSQNGCIGKNGQLPWHIPQDVARFKSLTTRKTVLMGRKTWDSIPERFRPLPNRKNLVLTRQTDFVLPAGVERFSSFTAALAAHGQEDICVIGGADIYAAALPLASRLEITEVKREVDGDAFFPPIDPTLWREIAREVHDEFDFVTYERT